MSGVALKRLCKRLPDYGLNISPDRYRPEGVRLLRTSDLGDDGSVDSDAAVFVDPADVPAAARLQSGDLLFSRSGTVGRGFLFDVERQGPATFAGFLVRFRMRHEIDPRAILYWSQSNQFEGAIEAGSIQSTIANFNAEKYANLLVPTPIVANSRAIADYLDAETARIDSLVTLRSRQVELLGARFDAVREAWLQELRREHGTLPLKRMAQGIEQGWSPECDASPAQPDEWGVLKTSSVSGGLFAATENKRLAAAMDPDPRWVVNDDDLLVVRGSGSPGAVAQAAVAEVNGRKLLLPDLLYRVRLVDADPWFVAHALRSRYARDQFEAAIRTDVGMTRKIRTEDLAMLEIPAVPLSQQRAAAEALARTAEGIKSTRAAARRQIELLRELRQALVTAAVTGQLEIPGVAG